MNASQPDDSKRVAELKEMERRLEEKRQIAAFEKLREQRRDGREARAGTDYSIHRR